MPRRQQSSRPVVRKGAAAVGLSLLVSVLFISIMIAGYAIKTPQASAYSPHPTISIVSDLDFLTPGNGVTSGSGTAVDPYIIEGWEILSDTTEGIFIHDTSAYFVIRNVYVHGSGGFNGVHLANLANGALINSTLTANAAAIRVDGSNNIMITGNDMDDQYNAGIWLYYSYNVMVADNSVDRTLYGIYTEYGVHDVNISNNSLDDSTYGGIVAYGPATKFAVVNNSMNNASLGNGLTFSTTATENSIYGNHAENNSGIGLALNELCFTNAIVGNTVNNNTNSYGIYLYAGDDNIVSLNTVRWNYLDGIYMGLTAGIGNNTIESNTISDNLGCGITADYNDVHKILTNTIERNQAGGIRYLGSNGRIDGNLITDNKNFGMKLGTASSSNLIANNTFVRDGLFARFQGSDRNTITSNTVNGKPLVFLENVNGYTVPTAGEVIAKNCSGITVRNLNLSQSTVGVEFWGTSDSSIEALISTGNTFGVFMENSSSRNTITLSNLSGNQYGVYMSNSSTANLVQTSILNYDSTAGAVTISSNDNRIVSNDFIGDGTGIQSASSQRTDVTGNFIRNGATFGIVLTSNTQSKIIQNDILNVGTTGISLQTSTSCKVENNIVSLSGYGIFLGTNADSNTVVNNTLDGNQQGIYLSGSAAPLTCDWNTVSNNTVIGNSVNGLFLQNAVHTVVSWNNVTGNGCGIRVNVTGAYSNWIYLNNFTSNTINARSDNSNNSNWWNTSTKVWYTYGGFTWYGYLGNRYGDYSGPDANGDGVGDTPYTVGSEQDKYPIVFTPGNLIPEFPSVLMPILGLIMVLVVAVARNGRHEQRDDP